MQKLKVFMIVIGSSLFSGCITTTVLDSDLTNSCLETTRQTFIHNSICTAGSGEYMLHTRPFGEHNLCFEGAAKSALPVGTLLRIKRLLKEGRGTTGSCLRMEVDILDDSLDTVTADLPVCTVLHPGPSWIKEGGFENPPIIFDESIVVPAPCSS